MKEEIFKGREERMRSRLITEFPYQSVDLQAFKRTCQAAPKYVQKEMLRAVKPAIILRCRQREGQFLSRFLRYRKKRSRSLRTL